LTAELSTAAALISVAISIAALIVSRLSVREARQTRNATTLVELYGQSMSDEFRELRGKLIHTDYFGDLLEIPHGEKHEQLHKLLGLYEMLGALARNKLVDIDLVLALFPRSVITGYEKARPYIEDYRVRSSHPKFAHNFEWLARHFESSTMSDSS
jgi:hypothetical protein